MAKTNSGLLEFKDAQKVLIALDDATSEVKKAVVIDADGVETDIQGVQPTGKKEITSTAEVNVADYATAQVVDADLVAGNIKKDVDILGVVGSYEGTQPTGKKEITSTAEVNVADYATAQVVDADLVAGNIKKDVDILGVVGSYEGGGGSSDFSTAEVIINVIGGDNFRRVTFDGLVSLEEELGQTAMTANLSLYGLNTVNCVLYNGYAGATIIAPPGFTITDTSADGDVSIEDNLYVDITGDGSLTVTISNE